MSDLTSYATAGLLTEQGQADFTAYTSAGLFSQLMAIEILEGRELIALHRQLWLLSAERNLDLADLRCLKMNAAERILEMAAAERNLELYAEDRNLDLCADEEKTW